MHITRLRLVGFKSFVEPTELLIEGGLTGVVGPNGCGKSNLLEALRWVMGETSHKSMRAAAMDDVIFSGTNTRPARNVAEVTIFLDNRARQAPAEFNDTDEIEITRRIEREAGSAYRINGTEARARDVKILFEDAATGARSPALVRQGQIGEIVNAKPENRRRILEDAAGVAGLHSRRHEAELRLKAAESNLARLADLMGALTAQVEGLKRQARQARRYKEISAEIRRAEALYFHVNWAEAQATVLREESALGDIVADLARLTEAESRALRAEAEIAASLQPLRDDEITRAAVYARLRIEQDNFEREAARSGERERELGARAADLEADIAREDAQIAEARASLDRLDGELAVLGDGGVTDDGADEAARETLARCEATLKSTESRLTALTQKTAEARAQRKALEQRRAERRDGLAKIERQMAALTAQLRDIAARAPDGLELSQAMEAGQRLAIEIAETEAAATCAEERVRALAALAKSKRDESAKARLAASAIKTERETLAKLLLPPHASNAPPVVDQVTVAEGYEAALGAALGDDLDASLVADAPVHWRRLDVSDEPLSLPVDV